MSLNINDICRVCLVPTTTRKYSNLFFSSGRSTQLWAKVMACAWVQVFEGDGLPSQICYKCHNKLDIAYQFKQQCEAADAEIRQYLNRAPTNKGCSNNVDLTQIQPECLAECKPLNFNITSECLDLAQTDLSLPAYRLMSQDIPLSQQIDFKIREHDFAAMKQEPGFVSDLNLFNPLPLQKGDCEINSSFKCESFNDSDIMLDSLPAKLFESVDEPIHHGGTETVDQIDTKLSVWDLQHKEHPPLINKNDFILDATERECSKNKENIENPNESEELSFLADERSLSPIVSRHIVLPEVGNNVALEHIPTECNFTADKVHCNTTEKVIDEFQISINRDTINGLKQIPKKTRKKPDKENQDKKSRLRKIGNSKTNKKSDVQEQCELCGKVFKYRSYMVQHLRTHTGVKPFACTRCDQRFAAYHSLVAHLRIHTGDRPFICAVCGKSFSQSAGLKSHMRAHSGEQPFECEICAKKFSQRSNLLIHKHIHSGQRDHTCTVCNIAFKFYKHLESHMKLHSGQKEFKCSVCEKSFHRKSYLRSHLSIHSGERPYKCHECGHAFANSSNLRAHSRVHSGIKPYKCRICKKDFTKSSTLNRHMQQHPPGSLPDKIPEKD